MSSTFTSRQQQQQQQQCQSCLRCFIIPRKAATPLLGPFCFWYLMMTVACLGMDGWMVYGLPSNLCSWPDSSTLRGQDTHTRNCLCMLPGYLPEPCSPQSVLKMPLCSTYFAQSLCIVCVCLSVTPHFSIVCVWVCMSFEMRPDLNFHGRLFFIQPPPHHHPPPSRFIEVRRRDVRLI